MRPPASRRPSRTRRCRTSPKLAARLPRRADRRCRRQQPELRQRHLRRRVRRILRHARDARGRRRARGARNVQGHRRRGLLQEHQASLELAHGFESRAVRHRPTRRTTTTSSAVSRSLGSTRSSNACTSRTRRSSPSTRSRRRAASSSRAATTATRTATRGSRTSTCLTVSSSARIGATSPDPPSLAFGQASVALVGDYSYFGFTSPVAGGRYRFEVSPAVGQINFTTLLGDYRRYFFVQPVTFAMRGLYYGRFGRGRRRQHAICRRCTSDRRR